MERRPCLTLIVAALLTAARRGVGRRRVRGLVDRRPGAAGPLRRVRHDDRRRLVGDHVLQRRRRGGRGGAWRSRRLRRAANGAQAGLVLFCAGVDRLRGRVEPPGADRVPLRPGRGRARCCSPRSLLGAAGSAAARLGRRWPCSARRSGRCSAACSRSSSTGGRSSSCRRRSRRSRCSRPRGSVPVAEEAPRRRRARGALAADVALGLVFAALVGALFLAVLLVITVWGLEPIVGALVVSALPAATLAGAAARARAHAGCRRSAAARSCSPRDSSLARAAAASLERARRRLARVLRRRDRARGAGADPRLARRRRRDRAQRGDHRRRASRRARAGPGARRAAADRLARPRRASARCSAGRRRSSTRTCRSGRRCRSLCALRDALENAQKGEVPDLSQAVRRRGRASTTTTCARRATT